MAVLLETEVVFEGGSEADSDSVGSHLEPLQSRLKTDSEAASEGHLTPGFIEGNHYNHFRREGDRAAVETADSGQAYPHTPLEAAEVVSRIREFVTRYTVLPDTHAELIVALWVLHTYAINAATFTPYLHITGPTKQCGKSRLLEVLEVLVYEPWLTSGASKSAVMRMLAARQPTLLFDEIDTSLSDENKDMLNVLNSGYQRGKPCSISVRTSEGGDWTAKDFDVFGPKAFSGIDELPHTVADRSIAIAMSRRQKDQKIDRFRAKQIKAEAGDIRQMIQAAISPEVLVTLADAAPQMPEELSDRGQDVLEPLIAIADVFGCGAEARLAAVALTRKDEDDEGDLNIQLLRDLRDIMDRDFVKSELLVLTLNAMNHRPWPTVSSGRPLTEHKLGRMLKAYKITSTRPQSKGNTARGYLRADVERAAKRYI